MAAYVVGRLIRVILTALIVVSLVFVIFRLVPGDPATLMAGMEGSEEDIAYIRARMGLDKPLHVQYYIYMRDLLHGNLGLSKLYGEEVADALIARVPATLKLSLAAVVISIAVGLPVGIISATRRNSLFDYLGSLTAVGALCVPGFWLGLMLIIIFAVNLRLLPAMGDETATSIILPAVTLAAYQMALIARITRSSMLEVIGQDYIRTARAKGLTEQAVTLRHALGNALIPIITVVGLQFGFMLGGSIVTETVFAWPGLGRLLVDSVLMRDYTVIQGITLFYSLAYITVNLITDLLYAIVDPRVRYR